MIESGEIDALYTARAPSTFRGGEGTVRRLFPEYRTVEQDYYRKTGIFPIMHVIAIRRAVYEKHPWIAQSLYKAFLTAQKEAYRDLHETAALKTMLPWAVHHVEEAERLMGSDYWSYGLDSNVRVLNTFLRYSYEQGLSKRQLTAHEIFAKEALESYKI